MNIPVLNGQKVTAASALDSALLYLNFTRDDLSVRTDHTPPDAFRLPLINYFFENPFSLTDSINALAAFLEKGTSYRFFTGKICDLLNLEPGSPEKKLIRLSMKKNPDYVNLIRIVSTFIEASDSLYEKMKSSVPDSDFDFLVTKTPELLIENEEPEGLTILESAHLWRKADSLTQRWYAIATRLNLQSSGEALYHAGIAMDSILSLIPDLPAWRGKAKRRNPPGITGKVLYFNSDANLVVLGKGENTVTRFYSIIIDLGGDDNYHIPTGRPLKSSWIIDLGGDDKYSGEDFSLAGGFFGTSLMLDVSGNDIYEARDFSVGCGVYGSGWIEDLEGDDSYRCRTLGIGAGFMGTGIIRDSGGHDTYTCSLYGEGFGGVYGVGLLLDTEGTDVYSAISSFTDVTRYEDHILTLSQGFAYGLRPYASGGIGLLIDSGGNDLYYSDIYGQGCSYWYGLGGLIDRSGNDYYLAHQYVQGTGVHLSIGYLRDDAGNDRYIGKGLAQGVGHDYGIGLFQDCQGNDDYVAYDLSQGAGSANGVGIFLDEQGNDAYISRVDWHTQGYGNPRRDYGSIGIFLDLQGKDIYTGRGENHFIWWMNKHKKRNFWGMGIDFE